MAERLGTTHDETDSPATACANVGEALHRGESEAVATLLQRLWARHGSDQTGYFWRSTAIAQSSWPGRSKPCTDVPAVMHNRWQPPGKEKPPAIV